MRLEALLRGSGIETNRLISWLLILTLLGAADRVALGATESQIDHQQYFLSDRHDAVDALITCEAQTTIFRTINFNLGVPVSELPDHEAVVEEACRTRDRFLEEGFFAETGLYGYNELLRLVVIKQRACRLCTDLNDAQGDQCTDAYFAAIDWLLGAGVDVNAGPLGTVLHDAVRVANEEMFDFLLSRGADPHYRAPRADVLQHVASDLESLPNTTPRSAIEYLQLSLAEFDEEKYPEVAAAWRRMLTRALEHSAAR